MSREVTPETLLSLFSSPTQKRPFRCVDELFIKYEKLGKTNPIRQRATLFDIFKGSAGCTLYIAHSHALISRH